MMSASTILTAMLALMGRSSTLSTAQPIAQAPEFGHGMLKEFKLAPGFVNLNHGSFGSCPKKVINAQRGYQDECEAMPDHWIRGGYQAWLEPLRKRLAGFLAGNAEDLVFIENASSGINAILRSLKFSPGDVIVDLSIAYGMVKNTIKWIHGFEGVEVVEIPVYFPGQGQPPFTDAGTILEAVNKTLQQYGSRVKMAIFCHISSVPSMLLPVHDLARTCKSHNVPVLIDGAHALGQIPVNLTDLENAGVTAWVGNGHKWLYSPKGSAVMWVSKKSPFNWQTLITPTVISSAFRDGVVDMHNAYQNEFQYTGTRDYTPFASMKEALEFRDSVLGGSHAIAQWNEELCQWAQKYLASLWATEVLLPESMTRSMCHVRVPTYDRTVMSWLPKRVFSDYNIYGTFFEMNITSHTTPPHVTPTIWIRLSAQVYLERSDFMALGAAVNTLLNRTAPVNL